MLHALAAKKFQFLRNTSIMGAYYALLCDRLRHEAEEIARKMTYAELSVFRNFMDEYMSALFLPHTNLDRSPLSRRA